MKLETLEKQFNGINELCNKCHGNFNDDCRDCSYFDKRETLRNQIKQLKDMGLDESGIISAEDAHNLTKKIIDEDMECLVPIMNKIKEASKKMQYHCYISAPIPDYVLRKLAILGYKTKLEKGDPRDPRETDNYIISW